MPYVHANIHTNRQDLKPALKVKKQMVKDTNEWRILKERKKKGLLYCIMYIQQREQRIKLSL